MSNQQKVPDLTFEIKTDDTGGITVHATRVDEDICEIDVTHDAACDMFHITVGELGIHLSLENAEALFQELGYQLRSARGYPEGEKKK